MRTPTGDDQVTGQPYGDSEGDVHLNATTVYVEAAVLDFGGTEGAVVKNVYYSPTIVVAVPTIADGKSDEVEHTIGAGMTFSPAVGDAVIAIPTAALPTDCLLNGAYVSDTDKVKLSFGTKEGGAGVTGANVNFKFLFLDLT